MAFWVGAFEGNTRSGKTEENHGNGQDTSLEMDRALLGYGLCDRG
jgi:hypothetical protein